VTVTARAALIPSHEYCTIRAAECGWMSLRFEHYEHIVVADAPPPSALQGIQALVKRLDDGKHRLRLAVLHSRANDWGIKARSTSPPQPGNRLRLQRLPLSRQADIKRCPSRLCTNRPRTAAVSPRTVRSYLGAGSTSGTPLSFFGPQEAIPSLPASDDFPCFYCAAHLVGTPRALSGKGSTISRVSILGPAARPSWRSRHYRMCC
jgi:hypothetical protein